MIALIIGLLALISAFSAFVKNLGSWAAFIFLIIVIVGAMFYVALRISYWTYFASAAIGIPLEDIIALFNKNNRESTNPFTKKPPSLVILQDAIWQHLIDEFNDGRLSWILKLIMIFLKRKKKEK
jgi:glucan phosphoethanolaminetransferase (alkaline phosphatase superfamily)